ncbi:hypothetical protein SAMN05421688_2988 [Poseidonocella pacifica]|uniref:Uncharacterized protein n=1 Tax=Poseidonocella pacifica TaxID=871651 RepID=A0A1I0YE06_9RHOB|nr:hypothetical protein SAMN05421688_2988 [Poseidonocella pacifica]
MEKAVGKPTAFFFVVFSIRAKVFPKADVHPNKGLRKTPA